MPKPGSCTRIFYDSLKQRISNATVIIPDNTFVEKLQRYQSTAALYHKGQPDFDQVMERISQFVIHL